MLSSVSCQIVKNITLVTRMTTPTLLGSIHTTEKLSAYLERVELFLLANQVPDDRKVPVFLNLLGKETYSILRSLLAPDLPSSKGYDVLVKTLKDHFEPKPVIIAERFHFHRRNQGIGESITDYLAELHRLSIHCEFEAYLEQALRDRLVCGLRSETREDC